MDKAFEVDIRGNEKIVEAEDIKKKISNTVSVKDKRFFCPQCGEYLSFVRKEKHKSFFRHTKLNEDTKKCELRVQGNEYSSLYEKHGLNLYIKRNDQTYTLAIGFRRIKSKDLNFLSRHNISFDITDNNGICLSKYSLNEYNFLENETTYKDINVISSKYHLKYSSPIANNIMKKYWGNEIEGINKSIGLFTYGELGGRCIRKNEEIVVNDYYYLISKSVSFLDKYRNNIICEKIGEVNRGNSLFTLKYNVYKIKFMPKDNLEFINIKNFCREVLNVRLVKDKNKIVTIWPPTIQNDNDEYYYLETDTISLIFNSYIENSFLTLHDDYLKVDKLGYRIDSENYIHFFDDIDEKIGISCNGNCYMINRIYSKYESDVEEVITSVVFKDINDNLLEFGENNSLPIEDKLKVETNFKCIIIHRKKDNKVKIHKLENSKGSLIDNIEFGDQVFIEGAGYSQFSIYFNKEEIKYNKEIDDDILFKNLIKSRGTVVKTPLEIRSLLLKLPNNSRSFNLIKKYVFENKMPSMALKYLKKYYVR